jgi:hypothetical protein
MGRMSNAPAKLIPSDRPFPPPQISDLLVLTLTAAYGMTWTGAFPVDQPTGGADWRARLEEAAATLVPGLLIGIELFGFAVIVRELTRGRRIQSLAPGHWWFIIAGPQNLLGGTHYLIAILGSTWFENQQGLWRMIESLSDAVYYLCFAAFWIWATASQSTWSWRTVLSIKVFEQLTWFAFRGYRSLRGFAWAPRISSMHFLGLLGTIHIALILSVIIAAVADRTTRTRRDWLHSLAAVAIIAESLQILYQGFGQYFVHWWSEIWFRLVG